VLLFYFLACIPFTYAVISWIVHIIFVILEVGGRGRGLKRGGRGWGGAPGATKAPSFGRQTRGRRSPAALGTQRRSYLTAQPRPLNP
jgi:hypothetical protein